MLFGMARGEEQCMFFKSLFLSHLLKNKSPLSFGTCETVKLFVEEKWTNAINTLFLAVCLPFQIVPHVVSLVHSFKRDGLPSSTAFLMQFTELIHCMMYHYSGFPELYEPILEAVKVC